MNSTISNILLFQLLEKQLPSEDRVWLKRSADKIASLEGMYESQLECFIRISAMTKRKLNSSLVIKCPNVWYIDEAVRLMLLTTLLEKSPTHKKTDSVKTAFKCGDESEQIAIIKGLNIIDANGELVDLAILNGRTNSLNLFGAIALNNDYPSKHYSTQAFHHLVLKALFMDLNISQVIGLKQRLCPELTHLAMDLVNERVAANRRPPESIACAIDVTHLSDDDIIQYKRHVN